MSDQANLQIKVTADVKQLQSELSKGTASVKDFEQKVGVSFNKAGQHVNSLGLTAQQSIAAYNAKMAALRGETVEAGKAIGTSTESAFSSIGKGATKAFSAVRQLAYILPGVGIAGILGFVAGPIIEYVQSLAEAKTATEKLTQARDDANQSLVDSAAKEAGNLETLKGLVSIAKDVTKSDAERSQALGKLNADYDIFNKSLTLANINTDKATKLIDLQTASIIRQAEIKGLQNLITKEAEKRAEALTKTLLESTTATDKFLALIQSAGGANLPQVSLLTRGLNNFNEEIKDSNDRTNIFTDALKKLLAESAKAGDLFKPSGTGTKKETIQDVLDNLILKLRQVKAEQEALGIGADDYKKKIGFVEEAITKLVTKFKQDPKGGIIQELLGGIDLIRLKETVRRIQIGLKNEFIAAPLDVPIETSPGVLNDYTDKLKEGLILRLKALHIPFNPIDNAEGLQKTLDEALARLDDFAAKTKARLVALKGSINGIISSAFADAASGIAQQLGAALGGAQVTIGGIFKSFLTAMAIGLKAIGRALIEYGIAKDIIKKLGLTGPQAVAAGIALNVFAAGLLASLKVPAFANGVRNFGGGVALVGERGPELVNLPRGADVIPNHALDGLGGDRQMIFIPEMRLRGQDIYVAFNRTSQANSRNT